MYTAIKIIFVLALLSSALCHLNKWQTRNYNQIRSIYDNVQYPKNVEIIKNGPPPGLFAQDVSGRINPIGNFTDINGLVEYFYALTPAVTNNLAGAALGNLTIVGFSSMCREVAAFSGYVPIYVYDKTKPNYGKTIGYLAQQGFFRFNKKGEVIHYDLVLESLQEVMSLLFNDQMDPANQAVVKGLICQIATASCNGTNLQYANFTDCMSQLNHKTYGFFWDAWSDTVACRLLHAILAQVDPKEHCPHVGPTGGGKCVNYPYERKYFLDNTQLFGSQSPFVCAGTPANPSLPTQNNHSTSKPNTID